jgi:SAM-dependent methyltransferase
MNDLTAVTEAPGSLLSQEQLARITQRYQLGAELARGQDVLEVACGTGVGLSLLQQTARSLVACDYTAAVLGAAQQHPHLQTPLVCADAQGLPFADHSFDRVLCFEAIYYFPHADFFLRAARRVLRAEGVLLIGTSNPDWPHFVPGLLSAEYPGVATLAVQLYACGFQQVQVYGAGPASAGAVRSQRWVAAVRKQLLNWPFFARNNVLTHLLKRLAYGPLLPLPAVLPSGPSVLNELTPLSSAQPDLIHRAFFTMAYV